MRQLCYTMIGKVIPERKASQQSVPEVHRDNNAPRSHYARRGELLDAGDCRFVACGVFEHFSGFGFSLLPSIVHACPSAMLRERKPLGARYCSQLQKGYSNMAEVVLFHHAQGLTPGVAAFADELRHAGHIVHTPDLFEGRTFDSIEKGMSYVKELGFGEVMARGERAVEGLPTELVYAGFSLGVVPAQKLAQTRPGARGALLFYSCIPVSEFGQAWPKGVPVQVHGMDADPIFVGEGDIDAARALVEEAEDGELFLYPGDQHYFADNSLPSYDAEATALLLQRVLKFLAAL